MKRSHSLKRSQTLEGGEDGEMEGVDGESNYIYIYIFMMCFCCLVLGFGFVFLFESMFLSVFSRFRRVF